MNTPTIQHVNDLGCCCPFPECPGNRWQHQDRLEDTFQYLYAPFIRPTGEEDDDIPTLWDDEAWDDFHGETGTAVWYEGWNENPTAPGEWAELRQQVDVSFDPLTYEPVYGWAAENIWTWTSNVSTNPPGFSSPTFDTGTDTTTDPDFVYSRTLTHQFTLSSEAAYSLGDADSTEVAVAEHWTVTEDVWLHYPDAIRYWTTEGAHALQGPGGAEGIASYHFDVTTTDMEQIVLSEPFTETTFIEAGITWLATQGFGSTQTTVPESSAALESRYVAEGAGTYTRWPWIQDANDWGEAPDYGVPSGGTYTLKEFRVDRDLRGLQYKVGIPADWETANNLWSIWAAEDPETRGEEPEGKRSVFECQWEEVFFPQAWEEWRAAHTTWESDYADWLVADPETRGDAPTEPTKPTATEDKPSLVQERDWTYGGPGTASFSDYFQMPPPDDTGKVRPVNMLIICYHAAGVGVKPTSHGETVNLADP